MVEITCVDCASNFQAHGLTKRCSSCKKTHSKKWFKEYDREYSIRFKTQINPTNYRRHAIKGKAKARGIHFDLTDLQCFKIWSQPRTYCHTTDLGKTFGMDRIDNSLGYVEDNVLPCCGTCNKIRGEALTVDEMKIAMSAILEYRRK